MAPTLQLATDLALPVSAITEKFAFLGRTGGGKTYAAMKLAEELLAIGAQAIVLDPVGKWYGLRVDGNGPGFALPVFGGQHGDYPLEGHTGRFVGRLVAERRLSAVLDVSMLLVEDQIRFATDFANGFFQAKKSAASPVHIFLEECQEFVPQTLSDRGASEMVQAWQRIWKIGRNFGIGGSLISQRPQEINKRVLNQTGTLFVFGMTGPQDRAVIERWVADQEMDDDIAAVLPKLKNGTPHVWSPGFLKISRTVRIAPKRTADVTSTPVFGGGDWAERPLTPVDAEAIKAHMSELVAEAERHDPKALRRKCAELEADVARLTALLETERAKPAQTVERRLEVPVFTADELALLGRVEALLARVAPAAGPTLAITPHAWRKDLLSPGDTNGFDSASTVHHEAPTGANGVPLDRLTKAILQTLARVPRGLNFKKLATLSGYRPSGTFRMKISELRKAGIVVGELKADDLIRLTPAGARLAPHDPTFQGGTLSSWIAKSDRTEQKILQALGNSAGRALTLFELARDTGLKITGSFRMSLSNLKAAGVIEGSNKTNWRIAREISLT